MSTVSPKRSLSNLQMSQFVSLCDFGRRALLCSPVLVCPLLLPCSQNAAGVSLYPLRDWTTPFFVEALM